MQLNENLIIAPIRADKSGQPGPIGPAGPKGEPGKDGLPPEHQWVNTFLRFKNPDGRWGNYTDLKGPKGEPGEDGNQMEVEDENGVQRDLEIIKYNSADRKVTYDPATKSLSINCVDHSYQLDWTVNTPAELPNGAQYLGAVVYVKNPAGFKWYDGTNWNSFRSDAMSPEELFNMMENGRWGNVHLNSAKDKIIMDSKDGYCGVYASLDELQTATGLTLINGKSFAIVTQLPGNPATQANVLCVYNNGWSPLPINGNFLYDNAGAVVPVTHLKAGDNVNMNYDATKRELTINSEGGGGGGPVDLSKYVRGEDVQVPASSANDWMTVNWDSTSRKLDLSVPQPNFEKMNAILIAGDNVSFEKDASTNHLKINASTNVDLRPYVRGAGIDAANGISANWDSSTTKLALGYSPKFTDLQGILEAGTNLELVQGTGEKAKFNYTGPVLPDMAEYAKKANIKIPTGYWGEVEVDGDDVKLKVGLTDAQIADMFYGNGEIEIVADSTINKVKFSLKDLRNRIYNAIAKSTEGRDKIIQPGKLVTLKYDEDKKMMTIDCDAEQFLENSVKTTLPLSSAWDNVAKTNTIGFDQQAFVNITDPTANVKVTYDQAKNKLAFNVDQVAVPVVGIQKDDEAKQDLGVLQITNAGNALTIADDAATGKKKATLRYPDYYQVTGQSGVATEKLTNLTVIPATTDQVVLANERMSIDLTKGYYVGKVDNESKLPTTGVVADKSYGYVQSANGYIRQYMYDGTTWSQINPLAGVKFGTANEVVTSIKNNNAVTFANGELTVNQSGMMYKDSGVEKALHSIEVVGTGVSATYTDATQALKLEILGGGSASQSPLKVKVSNPDGSVNEYADTREIVISGDVSGISGTDGPLGGKSLTLPVGILVELNTSVSLLAAKYPPANNKGKLIYGDSTDVHLRKWYGCDGENWIELTGKDFVDNINELLTRFAKKVPKSTTAAAAMDKTSWTYIEKGVADAPEYTKTDGSKVRVDGFLMNMVYSDAVAVQVFHPASDFSLPQYRSYNAVTSKWNDWVEIPVSSGGGGGDVNAHNLSEDAHEAIMLPAVVATSQTTWWNLKNPSGSSTRTGNLPMMLLSDSTGRADILQNPNNSQFYGVIVPRAGQYKMKLMFQITGAVTKHGDLRFSFLKNDVQFHSVTSNISTEGAQFDAIVVNVPQQTIAKGDRISVIVSYGGDTSWSDREQKLARIDPMKNYFVIEHVDSNSGSQIANTFRNTLGGFCATPGYGACVSPDQLDPSLVTLVEVTGNEYSTTVVTA